MKFLNSKSTLRGASSKILNSREGFTLLEILIYIAVLAVVILGVHALLIWTIHSNTKAKVMREVLDNSRRAMEIMTHEIREAKSIYTPTSTSTQLSLETKHYLPEGESFTYIDFYLCGTASTTLCLKKESQAPIALTSDEVEVNDLVFTQLIATSTVPSSIQIHLKIDYKNPYDRPELLASINTTSTASLRVY